MTKNFYSLEKISRDNDFVFLDTCAMVGLPGNGYSKTLEGFYFSSFEDMGILNFWKDSLENYPNFYVTEDVGREMGDNSCFRKKEPKSSPKDWKFFVGYKRNREKIKKLKNGIRGFFESENRVFFPEDVFGEYYLDSLDKIDFLFGSHVDNDKSDLGIVTSAYCLSEEGKKVSIISNDFGIRNLVFDLYSGDFGKGKRVDYFSVDRNRFDSRNHNFLRRYFNVNSLSSYK